MQESLLSEDLIGRMSYLGKDCSYTAVSSCLLGVGPLEVGLLEAELEGSRLRPGLVMTSMYMVRNGTAQGILSLPLSVRQGLPAQICAMIVV